MLTLNRIAEHYGLPLAVFKKDIVAMIEQSREAAATGRKSRWAYFDGYMSDTVAERNADGKAARDFEEAAYGGRD